MAAALFASNRGHGAVLHAGRLSGTIVVDRLGPLSLISDGGSGCYLPRLTGIWSDPLHHSRDRDMSSIPIVVSPSVRLPERSALPRNGSMAAVGRAPGLPGGALVQAGGYPPASSATLLIRAARFGLSLFERNLLWRVRRRHFAGCGAGGTCGGTFGRRPHCLPEKVSTGGGKAWSARSWFRSSNTYAVWITTNI